MKEIVHYAFITDRKATIIMQSGDVFEKKQIADYDESGLLTNDRIYILWDGICKVTIINWLNQKEFTIW